MSLAKLNINQAIKTINKGGLIAYPTEGVFGLGVDPFNPQAIEQVYQWKKRPQQLGLILIGANLNQIAPLIAPLTPSQQRRIQASWPGHITWICQASRECPPWLLNPVDQTIAVRVCLHPTARTLCRRLERPIVSTSANRHRCKPAVSLNDVKNLKGIDGYLPVPCLGMASPSTIRHMITGKTIRASS